MLKFGLKDYPDREVYDMYITDFNMKVNSGSSYMTIIAASGSGQIPYQGQQDIELRLELLSGLEGAKAINKIESNNGNNLKFIIGTTAYNIIEPLLVSYEYNIDDTLGKLIIELRPTGVEVDELIKVDFPDCNEDVLMLKGVYDKAKEDFKNRNITTLTLANIKSSYMVDKL